MTCRFLALILGFCGLAVTSVQARPRTVGDAVAAVSSDGLITLKQAGQGALAGIILPHPETLATQLSPQPVAVKSLGTDRYGHARWLLYTAAAGDPLQVELLQQGKALAYDMAAIPAAWLAAEKQAREGKRGFWGEKGWIIPAADAGLDIGKFRLVEGVVTGTYKGRDTYWINFGQDWKTDFSIAIPKRAWRSFGNRLEVAPGSKITARGVIELDNGPMLTISRPEQISIVETKRHVAVKDGALMPPSTRASAH